MLIIKHTDVHVANTVDCVGGWLSVVRGEGTNELVYLCHHVAKVLLLTHCIVGQIETFLRFLALQITCC
jgi:hypothetical protein